MKMANMNRRDIRKMFPNHMVSIDTVGVDLLDKETGVQIASVLYAESGAVIWLYKEKPVFGRPSQTCLAHVMSYADERAFNEAAQVERRILGRPDFAPRTLKIEWNKIQESDFLEALQIMQVFVALLAGNHMGCTNHQFKHLTAMGKRLNNTLQNSAKAEIKGASEGPATSRVASLARTLAEGEAERENASKRVVWGAEDEAIFQQVTEEHKKLSDRVAQLHSARGSKISIPEFDRRRKEKAQ